MLPCGGTLLPAPLTLPLRNLCSAGVSRTGLSKDLLLLVTQLHPQLLPFRRRQHLEAKSQLVVRKPYLNVDLFQWQSLWGHKFGAGRYTTSLVGTGPKSRVGTLGAPTPFRMQ